jgi:HlyD family secretion protein
MADIYARKPLYKRIFAREFWTWTKIIVAIVLLLVAGGITYWMKRPAPPVNYAQTAVTRGSLTVTVSASGTLQPKSQVDVGAEVSGKVDEVLVDYNDHVKAGQIIAVINTDTVKAQLAQSEATLATNQATLQETKAKRDRYRVLVKENAISIQDLQAAEAAYDRAVASIKTAQAQIQTQKTSIGKAEVRSPIDGVVLDRKISPGQTVASGFQTPVLFTLASTLDTMQLAVDIDEADIGNVREGQAATFIVDAFPQNRFDAKLISLHKAPQTQNNVVTYRAILEVDNKEALLRPGLTATADIITARIGNALLVPNGALRFTPPSLPLDKIPPLPKAPNGKKAGRVWVLDAKKVPQPRDLIVGDSDGRQSQVISGNLKVGEKVITDIATARPGGGNGP